MSVCILTAQFNLFLFIMLTDILGFFFLSFFLLLFYWIDPAFKNPPFASRLGLDDTHSIFTLEIIIKLWACILTNLNLLAFLWETENCRVLYLWSAASHPPCYHLLVFEFRLVFKSPLKFLSLTHPHPMSVHLPVCFSPHHRFLRFPPSFLVQFLMYWRIYFIILAAVANHWRFVFKSSWVLKMSLFHLHSSMTV